MFMPALFVLAACIGVGYLAGRSDLSIPIQLLCCLILAITFAFALHDSRLAGVIGGAVGTTAKTAHAMGAVIIGIASFFVTLFSCWIDDALN